MTSRLQLIKNVRRQLEADAANLYWAVSPRVGEFLKDAAITLNAQTVLEIGTSSGYSALWFAEALLTTGGHLFTIESHADRFRLGEGNFASAQVADLVTQIKGHAPEVFTDQCPQTEIDLAFFDATKKEYKRYLEAILPRLTATGVIIADNIASHWESLSDFIAACHQLTTHRAYYDPSLGTGMILIVGPNTPSSLKIGNPLS